ncbi:unnamed protein product [Porites evermanni]|uniref:Uncharacterized protein n=1 Tax=Porites evermanni TaxID=104178 RepID=A0ABN8LRL9_9CNID|nr:unnamed protein product [Porites evermanni]
MKQERFLISSRRPRFREFQFVVVLLIMAHKLVYKGYCFAPTALPSSPRTTKYTEILPKKFSRNTSNVDQRKQDCRSLEFSKVSASTTTVFPSRESPNSLKIGNQTKSGPGNSFGCSNGQQKATGCPRFVDTYSSFYLKIGGWLMLGIVLAGIAALVVTHYLGMRNMRRPRRRQLSRILWVEALTKSKLARFV